MSEVFHKRLELSIRNLHSRGFRTIEGECLRAENKHVSADKIARANDFMRLWSNNEVSAIIPPWGGELLIEILPLLDFNELRNYKPKWVLGYSDTSTLLFAMSLKSRIATAHGPNLMDLAAREWDIVTEKWIDVLCGNLKTGITQTSSKLYQKQWLNFVEAPEEPMLPTEKTIWKCLNQPNTSHIKFSGRLIGGCLDTISCLIGTPFGNIEPFKNEFKADGIVLYLENCEGSPCVVSRMLWNMRLAGWFENISGLLIGRSSGPCAQKTTDLTYEEALKSVLGDLNITVLYDVDVGHVPPQMTLINGAFAEVEFWADKRAQLKQFI